MENDFSTSSMKNILDNVDLDPFSEITYFKSFKWILYFIIIINHQV